MGSPGVGNMLELNSYGEKRQPANLRKNITTVFFYGGVGPVRARLVREPYRRI